MIQISKFFFYLCNLHIKVQGTSNRCNAKNVGGKSFHYSSIPFLDNYGEIKTKTKKKLQKNTNKKNPIHLFDTRADPKEMSHYAPHLTLALYCIK